MLVKNPTCLVLLQLILLCLYPIQISIAESTQKPDLSGVTTDERKVIEDVCGRTLRVMGPAAYYECLNEQLHDLERGPSKPDLSGVTTNERRVIEDVCGRTLRVMGPAAYYQCLNDQLKGIGKAMEPSKSHTDFSERLPTPFEQKNNQTYGKPTYVIEVSHNDELFIINGEKYEAQTYCFGFEEGDKVIFLKGSPFGACASAKILDLRNNRECRLWCE